MIVSLQPSRLSGDYNAPPSKSDSHRGLIAAALAQGLSLLSPLILSADIEATASALKALEADIQFQNKSAAVMGMPKHPAGYVRIFCNESGSTLRFLIPIVAALGVEAVFTGSGRLPQRPLNIYHELLSCKGVALNRLEHDELPLKVSGQLLPGHFSLPGNVSSQFLTGLLFALPLLQGDSEITLTSPLESKPYVAMTIETLQRFGVKVVETLTGYFVAGKQAYRSCSYPIEGDYSNAAFFAAAALLGDGITLHGLRPNTLQGDCAILELCRQFGAVVTQKDNCVSIFGGTLRGIEIDASQIPDLVPILAVIATFANGTTHIFHAHRLKLKESDRLLTITNGLSALGAAVSCNEDSLTIHGGKPLHGGVVCAENDHRIAMSLSIAALFCNGTVLIDGAECVKKSYPNFFEDYNRLGGKANVELGKQWAET